ncbi:putative regulatory protein, FmdB family [Syntrophus gentianae]|uniref:Putative regulatory protein, FmdB family n=1 Tax=Syntrophus gentianae TaxID=43775 RepID=A0A1H8A5J5_9BACT|nr:zinc ribbon domain-containing protein [Syntrophus gentianae]SEM66172.1 putative regulatory protein, FmdB family [Syntrophus gentianae]
MPIYEFYCQQCNTVYNFFSRTVNTEKIPNCPTCKTVPLKRQMSVFAKITRGKEEPGSEDMPPLDEGRMEKAMNMLSSEMDGIDEEDPRQAVRLMRKLSDMTGLQLGSGMEEALSRMERGEDPEQIEQEMGDLLDSEEPFTLAQKTTRGTNRRAQPRIDETLYDL